MIEYKLLKFLNKCEARRVLRKLGDAVDRVSSIYVSGSYFYLLVVVSSTSNLSNIWLSDLTVVEQMLLLWAKSEVDNSPDFIIHETNSYYVENAREISVVNGNTIRRTFDYLAEVVGIINCTDDSFSDGGQYNSIDAARSQVMQLLKNGVKIIDVGVESTRPQALVLSSVEELQRLKPFLAMLMELNEQYEFALSVDTYHSETITWLIDQDIDIINDVSGNLSPQLIAQCITSGKRYIAMHSLDVPAVKENVLDINLNPVTYLSNWMLSKVQLFNQHNINLEQVIFDPGIGFGNNPSQAWYILNNLHSLQDYGVEILVGHSRKSLFSHIAKAPSNERDLVTGVVAGMLASKVDYLRLHDVKALNEVYPAIHELTRKR